MNLINDPWIPVLRQDGSKNLINPWQIVETENPIIEINAPRADFQGALYQLLIGLLQTCFAPEDEEEWSDFFQDMPETDELRERIAKMAFAFELDNPKGVAFLQDYDLPDGESKTISALLIDAPGGKTQKDNLDHFCKRGLVNQMCPSCTATALFTLQTNAPSGGVGHRVGLRGGGPLTTLIIPKQEDATLWQRLWLNVFNQEQLHSVEPINADVFPWLAATRLSDKKGAITTPDDVHPLQMYWGMPRRIRLDACSEHGVCDLCAKQSEQLYHQFRTKNYGVNYDGAWVHKLTPYRFDPKKVNLPLSLKGQQGGLGYRHWLGLAFQDKENGDTAAEIVQFYNDEQRGREVFNIDSAALWCFGYDMDKMKARCWYDSRFPVFALDKNQQVNLTDWVREFILAAKEAVKLLRSEVKAAWFRRPEDAKGDMSQIDTQFWEVTEVDFYELLEQLAKLPGDIHRAPTEIYQSWYKTLQRQTFQVFETATLESNPEDLDLKRIVTAKNTLKRKFYANKSIKQLKTNATQKEVN